MNLKFKNFKGGILPLILFALVAAGTVFSSAQEIPNNISSFAPLPTPTPKIKPKSTPPVTNPMPGNLPKPPIGFKNKEKYKPGKTKRPILNEADTPAEKSIAVNPNVVVNLCVSE